MLPIPLLPLLLPYSFAAAYLVRCTRLLLVYYYCPQLHSSTAAADAAAMTAVAAELVPLHTTPSPNSCLKVDSLARIDLSTLSQSELYSLSLTSSAAFDLHNTDNLVIPELDRSVFNESTGSRRQTYSRPPRSPTPAAAAHGHRRRFAGLLPASKPPHCSASDDPEQAENRSIITSLKRLLGDTSSLSPTRRVSDDEMALANSISVSKQVLLSGDIESFVNSGERKRKRGRKGKEKEKEKAHCHQVEEGDENLEIVNKNGVVVDLEALAIADDPYGEVLGRRTVGMESEEELLGFLKNVGGKWGSRRKRRKIVDASEFGDALPIGWKLILALRRKAGRVSVYCRTYVSPSGLQFASCKEASSYLQCHFGSNEAVLPLDYYRRSDYVDNMVASQCHEGNGSSHKNDDLCHAIIPCSILPIASKSAEAQTEVALLGIENLAEVQVRDLFECHKCNMTFDEKDAYLQHLLSSHQKTTRSFKLRTSAGDGAILDGKYECQFCHKVFDERHCYDSHVEIHVRERNHVRSLEEFSDVANAQKSVMDSPALNLLAPRISKMDALIEIAQNSIIEASSVGAVDETVKLHVDNNPDSTDMHSEGAGNPNHDDIELVRENSLNGRPLVESDLVEQASDVDSEHVIAVEKNDMASNPMKDSASLDTAAIIAATKNINEASGTFPLESVLNAYQPGIEQLRTPKYNLVAQPGDEDCSVEKNDSVVYGAKLVGYEVNHLRNSVRGSDNELSSKFMLANQHGSEGYLNHEGVESPLSLEHCFSSPNCTSYKEGEFSTIDQKLGSSTGFDELRLDELEPLKNGFLTDSGVETVFGGPVQFETSEMMLDLGGRHQLTTVCVWCRTEFNHQALDSEIQSDSVGFMCPTCKAKISGQINELETAFSMNSHL